HVFRSGHHPADCLAMFCKDPIGTHRTHCEIMILGPAKDLAVKGEGLFQIASVKLAPANSPGAPLRRWLRHVIHWQRGHDAQYRSMRIRNDREPPDTRD